MLVLQSTFDNYTYMGDASVIAICITIFILLGSSYVSRTRGFRIFSAIIGAVLWAAIVNIVYHEFLVHYTPELRYAIYTLRLVYHFLLFDVLALFSLYASVVSNLEHRKARSIAIVSTVLFGVIMGADIALTAVGTGFRLTEDGTVTQGTNVFLIGYVLFAFLIASLMLCIRQLVYKRVMYGFFATMALAVVIRVIQIALNQSALVTMTFILPILAMLYFMHSTPYNVKDGTLDIRAMEDMVHNLYVKKEPFILMSLLLPDFSEEGKELPEAIRAQIRRFAREYFRDGVLFRVNNGQIVMIAKKKSNPDYEEWMQMILDAFAGQYEHFNYPYKIVYGESIEDISERNEYALLIDSVHMAIPENTVHRLCADDIRGFDQDKYILGELADIYNKRDVNDPRVLALCQPVLNIKTGKFDTAEVLMRLKLEKSGVVMPVKFIPIAESHGYIHVLTEIILHKTCQEIKKMSNEGYYINRISVNVSVLELKLDDFCGDIESIIENNGIESDKIALEITESQTDADFMIMKEKIETLHEHGIQFYLDDFGTGYSNMERIMEMPFDIIKFDRSMLIASGMDKRSERIVENLAHMFKDMDYSVLYEGVEDEEAEKRCKEMSASYLQGYKYSRPIPIENIRDFLPKAE